MSTRSTRAVAAAARVVPEAASLPADQQARRERIVAAASVLMVETDYDRIQVRDAADAARVALGTLYRYFASKDHLFACALLAWGDGFGSRLERAPTGPPVDRVKAVYRRAARAFERQPRVYRAMIQIQSSTDQHATAVFRQFADRQSAAFAEALDAVDPARLDDVVAVMSAVLDENLRFWQLGFHPITAVYAAIERAAELVVA
jgi:AcrR family transcriptional regulator